MSIRVNGGSFGFLGSELVITAQPDIEPTPSVTDPSHIPSIPSITPPPAPATTTSHDADAEITSTSVSPSSPRKPLPAAHTSGSVLALLTHPVTLIGAAALIAYLAFRD